MATSPEKVHALIDHHAARLPDRIAEVQQQVSGMAAVALGGLAPFLPSLLPQVVDQVRSAVPDDAATLDAILDAAAAHVLTLKSDPPAIDATAELAADDSADDMTRDPAGECHFCGAGPGKHAPSCTSEAARHQRPLHAGPDGGGLVGFPAGRPEPEPDTEGSAA